MTQRTPDKEFKVPSREGKWQLMRGTSPGARPVRTQTIKESSPPGDSKTPIKAQFGVRKLGNRKARKGGKKKGKGFAPSLPPELQLSPAYHRVIRYRASTALTDVAVTYASFIVAVGAICTTTNTTLTSWASSVKVNKITIWPAASGSATIEWVVPAVPFNKDTEVISAVPTGITVERAVVSTPPSWSLAKDWFTGSTDTACIINASLGSVIDVSFSFTLATSLGSVQRTVAAGTLASFYYSSLDSSGADLIVPIGLPTTT